MSGPSAAEIFFCNRLKLLRKQAGLTQRIVAELAGISDIYYQSIEAGRRPNVSLRIIEQIARAFGLSIHEFFSPDVPSIQVVIPKFPAPHRPRLSSSEKKKDK